MSFSQVARIASNDPYVQQLALELATDAIKGIGKVFHKKKKKKRSNVANADQLMLTNKPLSQALIKAPAAINRRVRARKPRFKGSVTGGVIIQHREYIGEINGSTTFNALGYNIQPGLPSTFPWLSSIAKNFEKYRIRSMTLHFVNVSATSERGRITMAYESDPLDPTPTNKIDLFAYSGCQEGAVWSPLSINIPCPKTTLFTREGIVPGTDLKTYDVGKLIIAASNTADSSIIGELFITYDIELMVPQPSECPGCSIFAVEGVTAVAPFGTERAILGTFPFHILSNNKDWEWEAIGYYLVQVNVAGSSPGSITWRGDATGVEKKECTNGDSNTESTYTYYVHCSAVGQYSGYTFQGTSVTSSQTYIVRIPVAMYP